MVEIMFNLVNNANMISSPYYVSFETVFVCKIKNMFSFPEFFKNLNLVLKYLSIFLMYMHSFAMCCLLAVTGQVSLGVGSGPSNLTDAELPPSEFDYTS